MTITEGLLFTMGNPLLDIQARVDKEFLTHWNLKENDAILCDEKLVPMFKEIIDKHQVEYVAGGSTQNTARVFQWMIGKKNVATYMGCIGKDEYGKILLEKANADGVNAAYQIHATVKTGTCAVLLVGNHRSLCAHLAAAEKFTVDHLEIPTNRDLMMKAQFYYIAGFFLTVCPPAIMKVAKHCAETNKVFSMNLSAPFLSQFFKGPMMEAFPYIDILFGNDDEAKAFAKEQNVEAPTVAEMALKIAALPKVNAKRQRLVVITQGSNSVVVAHEGKTREFHVEKLDQSLIMDTNGAGDAFVGGFLSQYVHSKSLDDCVKAGNYAARIIIQRSGCTFPAVCDYH